jgi:ubiquinone/menaquinone biosynthesis C-methylase UbiE
MGVPEYEYKGLMAQAWDLLRGDTFNWSDRFFYLEAIGRYGQPVLDVGCGTGRLLLDYLTQGIDIDGVDNSPEMLALCREKAQRLGLSPALYEQYMEQLALPRRYRTIIVPSSSLQLVIDPAMIDRAMQRFLAHMEPGGAFIAPFMQLWKEGDPLESVWDKSAERPEDGAAIRRLSRTRYDPADECEHTKDTYQVIVDGKVVAEETYRRSPAVRSYTQAQARALFERNGLLDVTLYHEFAFEPVRPEDTIFMAIGHKTG